MRNLFTHPPKYGLMVPPGATSHSSFITVGLGLGDARGFPPQVVAANLHHDGMVRFPLTKGVVTVGPSCETPEVFPVLVREKPRNRDELCEIVSRTLSSPPSVPSFRLKVMQNLG